MQPIAALTGIRTSNRWKNTLGVLPVSAPSPSVVVVAVVVIAVIVVFVVVVVVVAIVCMLVIVCDCLPFLVKKMIVYDA